MPITVARIPNLEYEAFYFDMERRGIELRDMQLGDVASALEQGEVDAGPVSLVDAFRLMPEKAVLISGSVSRRLSGLSPACCSPGNP